MSKYLGGLEESLGEFFEKVEEIHHPLYLFDELSSMPPKKKKNS